MKVELLLPEQEEYGEVADYLKGEGQFGGILSRQEWNPEEREPGCNSFYNMTTRQNQNNRG